MEMTVFVPSTSKLISGPSRDGSSFSFLQIGILSLDAQRTLNLSISFCPSLPPSPASHARAERLALFPVWGRHGSLLTHEGIFLFFSPFLWCGYESEGGSAFSCKNVEGGWEAGEATEMWIKVALGGFMYCSMKRERERRWSKRQLGQ